MRTLSLVSLASLLLLTATIASAQSRRQPFKFQVTAVDATTHQPRSTFFLGESVAVRISLTNQSGVARTVPQLPDKEIDFKLHSTEPYEHDPEIHDGYFGGTGWVRQEGNTTFWGSSPPRMMTIAPGQTISRTITLDYLNDHPLDEGTHTLTANYNSKLGVTISFVVVIDEAKSIPLLEKLAATPVQDGRDTLQRWASVTLKFLRAPSLTGRVVDTQGQPLKEHVRLTLKGPEGEMNFEGRKNGRFRMSLLTKGATYTVTPSLPYYNHPGVADYTFEPASKTVTVLNGDISGVDFVATKLRVEKNYALEYEDAKASASSTNDYMFEPDQVIDHSRMVPVGEREPGYWKDATPNQFPDWIEVDFAVTRRLNWINVFTLPDNLNDPPDPNPNDKFSLYGITDFDVQYWTGRAWRTVPGGAIRGNRNVWRMIAFPEIATNKIRVVVLNALGGESRITEIEAIHVNDLPVAKLAIQNTSGNRAKATGHTGAGIFFRTEAFDRDGRLEGYELEFGDGNGTYDWTHRKAGDKPQLTHTHIYESPGTYTVKLRLIDDADESSETTMQITITDPPKRKARGTQTSRR